LHPAEGELKDPYLSELAHTMALIRPILSTTVSIILSASVPTVKAQVVINEVCASNLNTDPDNYGQFEDWVELYNAGASDVDLGGWWMSNRSGNPLKWQVPEGVTIPAGGRQVIICSKRNEVVGTWVHASFNLNQTEEDHVMLSNGAGDLVDDFELTPGRRTQMGHSRGRTTDGANTWNLFTLPTPGAANAGAAVDYPTPPTLTPEAGFYTGPQSVTMSTTSGVIRYTLDGSEPTATSPLYSGPVNVNTTTVVRARAFGAAAGDPVSFTTTSTYFVNAPHTVSVISASGDQLDELLAGDGSIQPFGNLEYFAADGALLGEAVGEFNEHGQDSWAYDQRGFDYIARDQTGYNDAIRHPIFRTKEREKYQRLIIKAAAGDNYNFGPGQPAHIRDAYVQALSQTGNLRLDERSYEPAVVYINGQYWGVYDVREKVDDHDYTRFYYDQDEFNLQMLKTWGGTWSEYGGAQAQADWDALRNFIQSNNMGDPTAFATVDAQFNWKSLVDYFCLNSYTVCADWLNWNTGWWRGLDPNGEHKKWGYILWDMDATFGHYTNFTGIPDQSATADPCDAEQLPDPGGQGHTVILEKLITENQMVHDYYVNRYIDLGNTLFSCDHMLPFLDSLVNLITPEMPGQIARWGGSMAQWQSNVQVLRDFIEDRCVQVQEGMVDCYDLEGPNRVVFNVDPPLSGRIQINSIAPTAYPFAGDYYGGINTTLAPLPAEGWIFSHWEVFSTNTVFPSLEDSLVTMDFLTADSVVAHFKPPTRYEVLLDVEPRNSASITLDGVTYTSFPVMITVPEGIDIDFSVTPAMYHDFLHWYVKNTPFQPDDSTAMQLSAQWWNTDTIIAYLKPQDHVFFSPNAFSPNGDGFNDIFLPAVNVVDIDSYDFTVFDRWGGPIWQQEGPFTAGWDGTGNGGPVPNGVYGYRVYMIDAITKQPKEHFGHVTVVR
jgi:gliding motility-associated-like protein